MAEYSKRIENVEIEVSGWWNGRATVDGEIDEQAYEDFFDVENLDDYHEHMIKAISKINAEGNSLGDIVPADMLNEFSREQIFDQIMDGNMFGTIWADGNDIQWSWEPEVTLDGITVDFQDELSEASREHIAKEMLENQCQHGEVLELVDMTYDASIFTEEFDGKNGIVRIYCECDQIPSLDDETEISFMYDKATGEIECGDINPNIESDIIDFIKETCADIIKDREENIKGFSKEEIAFVKGWQEALEEHGVSAFDDKSPICSPIIDNDGMVLGQELRVSETPAVWLDTAAEKLCIYNAGNLAVFDADKQTCMELSAIAVDEYQEQIEEEAAAREFGTRTALDTAMEDISEYYDNGELVQIEPSLDEVVADADEKSANQEVCEKETEKDEQER